MQFKTIALLILLGLFHFSFAEDKYPVGLTAELPFITISYQGKDIKIKRIQDTKNRLVDDFSKTSRPCPPFCIHPMSVAENVETYGELEVLNFINKQVKEGDGLLVDARMPRFYNSETIPASLNIPFILFTGDKVNKIIELLGVDFKADKTDFSDAKELCLFCNGPWCDQSPRAIKALLKVGYPAEKLKYYRGGMQLWKIFSLTTVLPNSNTVEDVNDEG